MNKDELQQPKKDAKRASNGIAITSAIGLTVCFVFAVYEKSEVPIWVYSIFGGGILGTDNILLLIRSIFRIGGDK